MDNKKLLFALDIGTRSVVGLIGEKTESSVRLLGSERIEHHSRAMFDGQIHDVPEVAAIINDIKRALEKSHGELTSVAVAAAGRALITIKAEAELDTSALGVLTKTEESTLQLLAIQTAQKKLSSSEIKDPTLYYCVGFSIVEFSLDGTSLTSLIGQRGKKSAIKLIATFLPRQVIDSMQSALHAVGLEIATLTLEPIAAISVLIPPTMRHLNLVLVDVGAGTSDIAITAKGSVVGYGMVPIAGDEITEAISQKFLLDFNVAEQVKRQLSNPDAEVTFVDVLGMTQKLPAKDITMEIAATVAELAQAIATEIINLNTAAPQAVLLVGGGALTPQLTEALAQALDMPPTRVAVRQLEQIDGLTEIPANLCTPDSITPLGILKIASKQNLNFADITFNGQPLRLFNLNHLTVADALLASGIEIRSINGRPGLGLTIDFNDETRFIPGTHGSPCKITLNDKPARLEDTINSNDNITLTKGVNGTSPQLTISELIKHKLANLNISINDKSYEIKPITTVNGQAAAEDYTVADRDKIVYRMPQTLAEILASVGLAANSQHFTYTGNSQPLKFTISPQYLINDTIGNLNTIIVSGDKITIVPSALPTIGDILGAEHIKSQIITITFNDKQYPIETCHYELKLNGQTALPSTPAPDGSIIEYSRIENQPILSEILLAINFDPQSLGSGSKLEIMINNQTAEFTTIVKNGDRISIITK